MKTRLHLRVPLSIPVKIKIEDKDEEFLPAMLGDISWGGAFVTMDPPAAVKDRIILQFDLPELNVFMELWGIVVRQRPNEEPGPLGIGVEFDPLDEDTRSLIQKIITEEIDGLFKAQASR